MTMRRVLLRLAAGQEHVHLRDDVEGDPQVDDGETVTTVDPMLTGASNYAAN